MADSRKAPYLPPLPIPVIEQAPELMRGYALLYSNGFRAPTMTSRVAQEYFRDLSDQLQKLKLERRTTLLRQAVTDLFSQLSAMRHPLPIADLASYREQEQQFLTTCRVKNCISDCFQFAPKGILNNDPISSIQFYLCRKTSLSSYELRHLENMLDSLQTNHRLAAQYMQFVFTRRLFYNELVLLSEVTSEDVWDNRELDWSQIRPSSIEAIALARKLEEEMKSCRRSLHVGPVFQSVLAAFDSLDDESQRIAALFGLDLLTWYIHTFNLHFPCLGDEAFLSLFKNCPSIQSLTAQISELCAIKASPVRKAQIGPSWDNLLFVQINRGAYQYKQNPELFSTYRRGHELYIQQAQLNPLLPKQTQLLLPDEFDAVKIPTVPSAEAFDQIFDTSPLDICRIFSTGEEGVYQFLSALTLLDPHQMKLILQPVEQPRHSPKPSVREQPVAIHQSKSDFLPATTLRFHEEQKKRQAPAKKQGQRGHERKAPQQAEKKPQEKEKSPSSPDPIEPHRVPFLRIDPSPLHFESKMEPGRAEPIKAPGEEAPHCPKEREVVQDPCVQPDPAVERRFLDKLICSELQLREALQLPRVRTHLHVQKAFERRFEYIAQGRTLDDNLLLHTYPLVIAGLVQRYGRKKTIFSEHRQQEDDSYCCLGSIQRENEDPLLGNFTEGFFSEDNRDGKKGALFHHFLSPWTRQEITSFITRNAFESHERLEECQQDDLRVDLPPRETLGRYVFNVYKYRLTLLDRVEKILYTLAFPGGTPQL